MMNAFVFLLVSRALASAAVTAVPMRPLPLGAPAAAVFGAAGVSLAVSNPLIVTVPSPAAVPVWAAAPAPAAPMTAQPVPARAFGALRTDPRLPVEAPSVLAATLFDGLAVLSSQVPPVAAARTISGLRAMDADDAPWLDSVVGELERTRTGRRVLRGIARLEESRGYPVLVGLSHISNNGEFRYDSDILVMDAAHRRSDPALTAPIMAHELQHVLQRAMELPTDVLELEIESYTIENRIWSELGLDPPRGSFAAEARKRLLQGVDVFVPWLAEQYKNDFALHGHTIEQFTHWVEDQRATTLKRVARAGKDIAAAERDIAVMRANGMPEEAVAAHAREALAPAQSRLKEAQVTLAWCDRDLALLADVASRERFLVFTRGVIRRAHSMAR